MDKYKNEKRINIKIPSFIFADIRAYYMNNKKGGSWSKQFINDLYDFLDSSDDLIYSNHSISCDNEQMRKIADSSYTRPSDAIMMYYINLFYKKKTNKELFKFDD